MSTIQIPVVSGYSYMNPKLRRVEDSEQIRIFAGCPILVGEIIAVWGGMVRHKSELVNIDSKTLIHQIEDDIYLAVPFSDEKSEDIHHIKTSEQPNCQYTNPITLKALHAIETGEEITYSIFQSRNVISGRQEKLDQVIAEKLMPGAWGLLTSIDLENCQPQLIRDAEVIKQYVYQLCDLIEMKRFGECHVVHFGEDERVAGYSMFQLIETSCISAHFANETNTSYLDIFSCKEYDPAVVADFSQRYFKGGKYRMTITNRF